MARFQVRAYEPRDREAFGHVRSRVYRGGDPVLPDERLLRADSTGYVVELEGRVVGAATVLEMTCSRNGELHRCAGVASVATLPEVRGTGAGSALIRGTLPLLKEAGYVVSSLHPFRDSWYRRFGYVGMGRRLQIKCPADRLPNLPFELPVRELKPTELGLLDGVVRHTAQRYNGFNVRTPDQWWRMTGGDTPMAIYGCGEPVEAYAILRLNSDFWVDQEIREVRWSTDRGYRSMLALFKSLSINKRSVTWVEPGDSPFVAHYYDRVVSVELLGPVMFRLLDAPDESVTEATRSWLGRDEDIFCPDLF